MLMQNFKSAADLGISEPQLSALQKTLVLMETGKIRHTPMGDGVRGHRSFAGQFNMNQWNAENSCGTIACIGGTAELVGNVSFDGHQHNVKLHKLFYPHAVALMEWKDITETQAATALRSYLTTGNARWDLAVA